MFSQHSQMEKDCRFCSRSKAFVLVALEHFEIEPVSRVGEGIYILCKRILMGIVIHYNPIMLPFL